MCGMTFSINLMQIYLNSDRIFWPNFEKCSKFGTILVNVVWAVTFLFMDQFSKFQHQKMRKSKLFPKTYNHFFVGSRFLAEKLNFRSFSAILRYFRDFWSKPVTNLHIFKCSPRKSIGATASKLHRFIDNK